MVSMTTNLDIQPSTTTSIPARDGRAITPYRVVPERLVRIDGVDYVRCYLHGLIPLDHQCKLSPLDHWCRIAAHPTWDPELPADQQDCDQGVSHDEWSTIQSIKVQKLSDALLLACLYLEGFVWVSEPEFSEMESMKATCAESLGCKTWEQAMELAKLREARRGER